MSDSNDERLLLVGDEGNIIWKSGQVDTPIASRSQSPKQRMLNSSVGSDLPQPRKDLSR